MSKSSYNPYKYTAIVLAIVVAVLFFFSPDCIIPYYIYTYYESQPACVSVSSNNIGIVTLNDDYGKVWRDKI